MSENRTVKDRIRLLYEGRSKRATNFRYGLLFFDAFSILFFLATAPLPLTQTIFVADILIGAVIVADLVMRFWISSNRMRLLRRIYVLADFVVLASLIATPFYGQELAMLRVLRSLRLVHSYHLLHDLRRDVAFFRRNEDPILAAVNLLVFIFATAAVVYTLRGGNEPDLNNYIDALYFTVATLTTTGFGDIVMTTSWGRLLTVGIMVVGVGLFLQLVRSLFSPAKIKHKCPECGLLKHDIDAIHCKHCGHDLKIETEGAI